VIKNEKSLKKKLTYTMINLACKPLFNISLFHRQIVPLCPIISSSRGANTKPWAEGPKEDWNKGYYNYEWRRLRGKKFGKVQLPDFESDHKKNKQLTPEEMRSVMKQKGVVPHRSWHERPMVSTCSPSIIDPFKHGSKTASEEEEEQRELSLKEKVLSVSFS